MSGLSNKVVAQAGEFAVCAQLGKLGLIATPFAGNVPGFDVLAVDKHLNCVPIQVKTSRSDTWITGDISTYVEVSWEGQRMIFGSMKPARYPDLIRVYVRLGGKNEHDRYFIITESELYKIVVDSFKKWIGGHDFTRPKNPHSLHSAIYLDALTRYEDNWDLVTRQLEALQAQRGGDQGFELGVKTRV